MDVHSYAAENPKKPAYDISDKRMSNKREKTDYTTTAKSGVAIKNLPQAQNNTRAAKQAFLSSNVMNGGDTQKYMTTVNQDNFRGKAQMA